MTTTAILAIVAMGLVAVASAVIGSIGVRVARSTSDFLVASRTVGPTANASAISGEYLSAASFLGIAGLILRDGVDALWYPVGYAAGYLALVLFVAAPLRRSGAYTVPDFAEARLRSPVLRMVCTIFVIIIGWLYLLPQLQGAGLTIAIVTSLPSWTGEVAAAVVVVATVLLGGMRSITFVQAFQYWFKFAALALPAVIALVYFVGGDRTFDRPAPPVFTAATTVSIDTDVQLQVRAPVDLTATGLVDGVQRVSASLRWEPGTHTVKADATLDFLAGSPVPIVAGAPVEDADWLTPFPEGRPYGLLATYSLILATFLGTMGLPHVLVRFYTNPDGRAARRTAVVVLALIGAFYMTVTLVGALSRLYTPQLLVSGDTDAAVLLLPSAVLGSSLAGAILGAVVAAGAWAAFLSTSSGLVVSIAGVLSTDLLGTGRVRDFRLSAVLAGAVPLALSLFVTRLDFSEAVALVFAVAASTFCPLLLLGIWWRGLTDRGAIAGVLVGGLLSAGAVGVSLAGIADSSWAGVLLYRPALVSVPAAFLVMVGVSKLTAKRVPADADQVLLQLHAPERLGLSRDRLAERGRPGG
ncbi:MULTISPECIES: cation acetate symporter [unclassified Pseudonocardia]|uniref:sodium/solute symporter n=1 Tax=unclassified Pseudonocardia TaxID=2619320 RepID=UPI000B1FB8E4|nr:MULTISPECIES: cation acetate symporter [unclassified Pseudonocardia]MBN9096556.1 cation acetate symporter [Pseudonocardia sp.]